MGTTFLFNTVGDNKVVYIFSEYYEQAALEGRLADEQYTWAVDPSDDTVVYLLVDGDPMFTFDVVNGELVLRVIVPEGNKVYFYSVEGYIMTLLFNDNNKVYIYHDTLTEEQAEQTNPVLEGTWVQQDNLITITVGGEPFFMSFTVDGSTLTPVMEP